MPTIHPAIAAFFASQLTDSFKHFLKSHFRMSHDPPQFDSLLVWAAIGRLVDEPDRMIGSASAPSSAAMDRIDNAAREHLVSRWPLLALATHS
jgi:hypothetical protein